MDTKVNAKKFFRGGNSSGYRPQRRSRPSNFYNRNYQGPPMTVAQAKRTVPPMYRNNFNCRPNKFVLEFTPAIKTKHPKTITTLNLSGGAPNMIDTEEITKSIDLVIAGLTKLKTEMVSQTMAMAPGVSSVPTIRLKQSGKDFQLVVDKLSQVFVKPQPKVNPGTSDSDTDPLPAAAGT